MGGSTKWFKSLFNPKKPTPQIFNSSQEKEVRSNKGSRKWILWRSSKDYSKRSSVSVNQERNVDDSDWSISSFKGAKAFSDSIAVSRGCRLIRQELAAVRIQTFFRRFLARQAFRALRAVVRIQAIFRGRQIRKQAAITLKCMQALVRVQARVRARSAWVPSEGRNIPALLHENLKQVDPIKEVERRWCSSPASADEVRTKLQMRLQGALKRERALAYYLSQQLLDQKYNNERNRLQKEVYAYPTGPTKIAKRKEAYVLVNSPQHDPVTVRKNNVTKKIGANPPQISPMSGFSCPGSEFMYDGFSHSATFLSAASPSPMHRKGIEETKGRSWVKKPSFMSPTQSIKAKQREGKYTTQEVPRDRLYHRKSASLSLGYTSSTFGSDPSPVSLCKDLYPPIQLDRYDRPRLHV